MKAAILCRDSHLGCPPSAARQLAAKQVEEMPITQNGETGSSRHHLKFRRLPGEYAVVRLAADAPVPDWATAGDFTSITRSADELSVVCAAENLPRDLDSQHRWICLKLEGPFPFSQTGILLSFIEPLSNNGVPIFAMSTYDTDYVLIQEEFAGVTLDTLRKAGHELVS
jgi:hypothetical protein